MKTLSDFQTWLDEITRAYTTGDRDVIRPYLVLPLTIVSTKGTVVHKDEAGINLYLDYYLESSKLHGVTDVIRLAKELGPMGEGRLLGGYENHYLRGANYITRPYMSTVELLLDDGRWKIAKINSEVEPVQWRSIASLRQQT
ncbi:hypothetical protein DI396_03620 [Litorivita pollutaquae]|uniref:DUF4440 domain-containing protein n=1 Tax=Litorivita pollutaquae TaxID=2200892 RepID=A0A2V4MQX4_9RHOB|nr:hypothetical protein [Litorivita pollutaquae]OUS20433.1 hypothetical protein A9Q95_08695 [Rhodobacterales bacterium 59_46_T64]PYC49145.1 hypothetical protein DI396_03620 [Litorivita pollutaquae]